MELLKKLGFLAFVMAILFLFIWALYLPKKDITATISKTIEEQKSRLDLFFSGVTFQESSNGVKYWEINAKTSSLNKTTNIATLEEAQGTFFKKGVPVMKFISPHVVWNMNQKEIQLTDPIGFDLKAEKKVQELLKEAKNVSSFILPARALSKDEGYFFKAKSLNWKLSTERIVCSSGIYIKKGEISGVAEKLTADVALEKINIIGNPCVLNLYNNTVNTIEAKSFDVDSAKDELSASGGVILTANGLKLIAQDMVYKQREDTLYFKPAVEVNYQEARANSRLASYRIKDQEIILEKDASLIRSGSRLTGDRVAVSLKNKTFKVAGKTKLVIPGDELK